MSEKRYGFDGESFTDKTTGGIPFYGGYACDLLNSQAETIEVLREWIQNTPINDDYESLDDDERMLIKYKERGQAALTPVERIELAKRRIAALEGK